MLALALAGAGPLFECEGTLREGMLRRGDDDLTLIEQQQEQPPAVRKVQAVIGEMGADIVRDRADAMERERRVMHQYDAALYGGEEEREESQFFAQTGKARGADSGFGISTSGGSSHEVRMSPSRANTAPKRRGRPAPAQEDIAIAARGGGGSGAGAPANPYRPEDVGRSVLRDHASVAAAQIPAAEKASSASFSSSSSSDELLHEDPISATRGILDALEGELAEGLDEDHDQDYFDYENRDNYQDRYAAASREAPLSRRGRGRSRSPFSFSADRALQRAKMRSSRARARAAHRQQSEASTSSGDFASTAGDYVWAFFYRIFVFTLSVFLFGVCWVAGGRFATALSGRLKRLDVARESAAKSPTRPVLPGGGSRSVSPDGGALDEEDEALGGMLSEAETSVDRRGGGDGSPLLPERKVGRALFAETSPSPDRPSRQDRRSAVFSESSTPLRPRPMTTPG